MLIPCSRAQAMFADPGIRLARHTPGFMVWDEHGGTFVLRVDELAATEVAAGEPETRHHPGNPPVGSGGTHSQPGRIRRPATTPAGPALGSGTGGGCRPGGLSPAGPEPVRLCRRAAPGSQKTRRGRGTGARPAPSRPGGSPARKPIWSFTSPGPPWPGWWPWCSAWPGAGL